MKKLFAVLLAAGLLAATAPAGAQDTIYRCGSHGRVTYTQVPCFGGREVGEEHHHETSRWIVPPQDRARAAKRAALTPEQRHECKVLDGRLLQEHRKLKAMGAAATLQDEMPFVRAQKEFREGGC